MSNHVVIALTLVTIIGSLLLTGSPAAEDHELDPCTALHGEERVANLIGKFFEEQRKADFIYKRTNRGLRWFECAAVLRMEQEMKQSDTYNKRLNECIFDNINKAHTDFAVRLVITRCHIEAEIYYLGHLRDEEP